MTTYTEEEIDAILARAFCKSANMMVDFIDDYNFTATWCKEKFNKIKYVTHLIEIAMCRDTVCFNDEQYENLIARILQLTGDFECDKDINSDEISTIFAPPIPLLKEERKDYLLQENGYKVLQENGYGILI